MTPEEQQYLVAKEEYALECKAFYDIRTSMPKEKKLRSLSQRTDYEYARFQVSKAAKRLQDAYILWKAEERLAVESEALEQKEARARFGNVPEALAQNILAEIEKVRRKA